MEDSYTNKTNSLDRSNPNKRHSRILDNPPSPAFSSGKQSSLSDTTDRYTPTSDGMHDRNQSPLPESAATISAASQQRRILPKRTSHENIPLPPLPVSVPGTDDDMNLYESIGGGLQNPTYDKIDKHIDKDMTTIGELHHDINPPPDAESNVSNSPEKVNFQMAELQSMSKMGSSTSLDSNGVKILVTVSATPSPEHERDVSKLQHSDSNVNVNTDFDTNGFEAYAAVDLDKKKQERLVKDTYAVVGPKSRTGTVASCSDSNEVIDSQPLYEGAYTIIPGKLIL